MHGGEHQVTGFRRIQGEPHHLRGAHLTDDQNIGVLTQGIDDRLLEARRMSGYLPLPDVGAAVGIDVFERAFERDDVLRARGIRLLDERRKRGGLTASCRTRHDDESGGCRHQPA